MVSKKLLIVINNLAKYVLTIHWKCSKTLHCVKFMFCRETCEEYEKAVSALALRVLHMISLSLGLPAKRLDDYLQNQGSYLLVNYYPTCPNSKLALGVGPHKNADAFTILAQDAG